MSLARQDSQWQTNLLLFQGASRQVIVLFGFVHFVHYIIMMYNINNNNNSNNK